MHTFNLLTSLHCGGVMTVKEVAWTACIVTAAEGIIFWISPVLRESARGVGHVVGSAIASSHWLLWTSTWIFSILMLVAETIVSALLILGLVWLLRVFAKAILDSIAAFQREFERFSITLSRKLTDGAKDAGFMAIFGILSAVVAYLNTEDFFK